MCPTIGFFVLSSVLIFYSQNFAFKQSDFSFKSSDSQLCLFNFVIFFYLFSSLHIDFSEKGRESPPKISLRRTSLEAFCSPREQPFCSPISQRYRTYDGTCNNPRKGRWGSAQLPFNRFQSPAYADGIEELRQSVSGGALPSPRFISLLVHGSRESDSPVTLMLAQWGQFIDHDLTSTQQPR